MSTIKTAISVDADLFKQVEQLAAQLKISRSQLFAKAAEELVRKHKKGQLLRQLNEAYDDASAQEDVLLVKKSKRRISEISDRY